MSDPFAWADEETTAPFEQHVEPAFGTNDRMAVVRQQSEWTAPAPGGAIERPEWNIRVVIDFVLGASKESICEEYNFTEQFYERMVNDVGFLGKVAALQKELSEKDGATFTLKAKLQAEVLLDESFKMAMSGDVDSRVRAKLIADTVRWAGFDKSGSAPDGTGGFSININLNGKRPGGVFDGEAEVV